MHQMRLTETQISELLSDATKKLLTFKTTGSAININFSFPTPEEHPKARLIIKNKAWLKMSALISECSKEIAWHGLVTKNKNTYTVEDIVIFPQTVTGATVTSDETEYSLWLAQQPDEIFNKIRFHGHSHVNMGVSPSGVDTEYQDNILKNLNDFYIFMIMNKKGDSWCAIYDVEDNIAYENNDIDLCTPETSVTAWAQTAIKEFVQEIKPVTKSKSYKKPSEDDYIYGGDDYYYNGYYGGRYGQK